MNQYQQLDEDILAITGMPEWKSVMTLLEAEHAAATQNQLDAATWETTAYQKGYRAGLSFIANLREYTKALIQQDEDNASV